MKFFVTGAEGQLARCLAERAGAGLDIVCAGRPRFDLLAPEAAIATVLAARPDALVNAAAYTAVDKAETEPHLAFAINRDGAAAMARAAAALRIPFIHISTDYVFSGAKPEPYVEGDETGPLGVYGQSKLEGEIAVRAAAPRHAILRTSWVYSPFGANFVKTMLRFAREREALNIVDDQIGCPTAADDLAGAVLAVAQAMAAAPELAGTFHAAGQGSTSWFGLAREIFAVSSGAGLRAPALSPIPTSAYPTPARRPRNSSLDSAKLAREFGFVFPSWQSGVRRCVLRLASAGAKAAE
jgi:dTDP-4-dehydrorhamnose reductase